ncbi:MAG: VCBS repeat-containing protein [Planctomycetaceae bacterium]|nr:VCBS repeat-containing protein [Planctomycetaceae bacterium]
MNQHSRVRVLILVAVALASVSGAAELNAPARFTEHLIADGYGYAYGVAAADLDGDGDLDLTSCDTVNNALYWYENDGKRTFRRHFIQKDETGWFERHVIGDINGDKHPDVVVVKNLDGHVVWFENSGQPAKDATWKRHVINTDMKRAYDVALLDVNADGRLDVAASAWTGNHFAWFANPGRDATNAEWPKHLIDKDISETRAIRAADFNGDGKPDLLGTARTSNLTAWYEHKADGAWTRHVIDDRSPQPIHGHPVDMDGDGDPDVVMALGMLAPVDQADTNQIAWYENVGRPGKGEEWKKHVIGLLPYAFEAVAGDLDKDGDMDVVGTAWGGTGQVVWFENSGKATGEWTAHMLKDKWPRANQAIIADLDGDQRPDIAATAERGTNELRWWRNVAGTD